jgi:hypothetical protein
VFQIALRRNNLKKAKPMHKDLQPPHGAPPKFVIHLDDDPPRPEPPFRIGDKVRHVSHPDGAETVLACKWESFGAPRYWVATTRGSELVQKTRYAAADRFEFVSGKGSFSIHPAVERLARLRATRWRRRPHPMLIVLTAALGLWAGIWIGLGAVSRAWPW